MANGQVCHGIEGDLANRLVQRQNIITTEVDALDSLATGSGPWDDEVAPVVGGDLVRSGAGETGSVREAEPGSERRGGAESVETVCSPLRISDRHLVKSDVVVVDRDG